jgi:heme/copper-type cytochrome/quinol oxidase subunit 2
MDEQGINQIAAVDGLVLAMLCTMVLSMGVIGLLVFCMFRNVARRNHQVDDLLEEVAETERLEKQTATAKETEPQPAPWERSGDWWKD